VASEVQKIKDRELLKRRWIFIYTFKHVNRNS
jgi:hypothetical protein